MAASRSWFDKWFSTDRRRAERRPTSEMDVYFWNGSHPVRHRVRDISETGMYLLTDEHWRPGTVLLMTLQIPELELHPERGEQTHAERVLSVQARAIRVGEDGVALKFLLPHEEKEFFAQGREGADKRALQGFLHRLFKEQP